MRLEQARDLLRVVPESEADVAFLEDTLGIRAAGDSVQLVRVDARSMGLGSFACLEAKKAVP